MNLDLLPDSFEVPVLNVDSWADKALSLKIRYASLTLKTPNDCVIATEIVGQARKLRKEIQEAAKHVNKSLKEALDFNKSEEKSVTGPLEDIEKSLGEKISAFQSAAIEAAKIEQEDASSIKELMGSEVDVYVSEKPRDFEARSASTYQKESWQYSLEDFERIPRSYLALDESKVKAALKLGIREIPGLKIYQETKTIVRIK